MNLFYSFIIPVFNRPLEIKELLESFMGLSVTGLDYEIILIEDGSSLSAREVFMEFEHQLPLRYYFKNNSGPGDSRNYGMELAHGNYFIILDSDVLVPEDYLQNVNRVLKENYADVYGGPDAAHASFTAVQKAINFSMTSFLTTGGIRGASQKMESYKPRSFNMGLSKKAFEESGGFAKLAVGEDLDLSIRLKNAGYHITYIPGAKVYHKRRNTFKSFYRQVSKFGMGRPILEKKYPEAKSLVSWFPSIFIIGLVLSLILGVLGAYLPIKLYLLYFILIFVNSSFTNKSIKVGFLSLWSTLLQFTGYGMGFIKSTYYLKILKRKPEDVFPYLFYK